MRTFILAALIGALGAPACTAYSESPDQREQYGYDEYEDEDQGPEVGVFADLSFYGDWYRVSAYGWVWRPAVAVGWQPFYHGHWVWTDYGWMWISYEPFGWATCHYGNWMYDFSLGWVWIPGYQWSPARVNWVVYDNYVCWAPLPPRGYKIGYPWAPTRVNAWTVVYADRFTDTNVGHYRVKPARYKSRYKSDYAMRGAVHHAPGRNFVEKHEGRRIRTTPVEVEQSRSSGRNVRRIKLPREQSQVVERNRVHVPRQEPSQYKSRQGKQPREQSKEESKSKKKSKEKKNNNKGSRNGRGSD